MTPKEQRYLFIATYFTVQGLFLMGAMVLCIYNSRKYKAIEELKEKPDDWKHDRWDLGLMFVFFAKIANSGFLIVNWANFIDPEGA